MEYSHAHNEWKTQSFFSTSCDCGSFFPYVEKEEANGVTHLCQENGRRNMLTCKDKYLNESIDEVNSLDMNTAELTGCNLSIESDIPVIPKKYFKSPASFIIEEIVAISVHDIFVSKPLNLVDGRYRIAKSITINQNILLNPIFKNKKVILLFDQRDILLEYLWENRDEMDIYRKLSDIGFLAITTPNFSLFIGECPVGHALNIKKGLEFGVGLEKHGATVIPHIYGVQSWQLERWTVWLKKNSGIKIVAMNCQMQRKSEVGRRIAVTALSHLLTTTDVDVIIHGGDKRILECLSTFKNRIHMASSGTFKRMEIFKKRDILMPTPFIITKKSVRT